MVGIASENLAWLNYGSVFVMFLVVVTSWWYIERRFKLNGDRPALMFRMAWGFWLLLACYIIAWPIPADEPWLIIRAAIGRSIFICGVLSIGRLMWTYDRAGADDSRAG